MHAISHIWRASALAPGLCLVDAGERAFVSSSSALLTMAALPAPMFVAIAPGAGVTADLAVYLDSSSPFVNGTPFLNWSHHPAEPALPPAAPPQGRRPWDNGSFGSFLFLCRPGARTPLHGGGALHASAARRIM